jgi:hypothetical protein
MSPFIKTTQLIELGLVVVGATLSLGCSKTHEREAAEARAVNAPGMTPASRTRSAAEQIAVARCEREQACGNIGDDKTFSSLLDCRARIQNDWKDDLNARACPGGVNQHELGECMSQVRTESCGNPFDTLARITSCTQAQICIEEP